MTTSERVRIAFAVAAFASAGTGGARFARAADDLPRALDAVNLGAGGGAAPEVHRWQVAVGGRSSFFRGAGYDPFSTNDVFGQFSAIGLRAFPMGDGLTSAAGLIWEAGSATADARGGRAELAMYRAGLVLEQRFAPRRWAYVFGRLSPAWLMGRATLADVASPAALATSFGTFAVDASLGLAGDLNPRSRRLGIWALADAGYGWAPSRHLTLAPDLAAADRAKAGTTSLGDLAPRGVFVRVGVAVAF